MPTPPQAPASAAANAQAAPVAHAGDVVDGVFYPSRMTLAKSCVGSTWYCARVSRTSPAGSSSSSGGAAEARGL